MGLDGNQYKIIVESAPNMLWRAGKDALCDYFNATWLNFTGRTLEQEVGNGWAESVHPEDFDQCLKTFLEAFHKREIFEMIYRVRRYDGAYRWLHDRGVPFYDDNNEFAGFIGSCIDVNEQITGETWKVMAQKDGLTDIFNRQHFEKEAGHLFDMSRMLEQSLCAVMIDIDDFKHFNDHYGHAFGDRVLKTFAGILKDNIRDIDLLGRYGGDEFILFLPDTGYFGAAHIVNRIMSKMILPFSYYEGTNINLAFSYGIAELKENDTFASFIDKADQAMYAEKKRKKETASRESTLG